MNERQSNIRKKKVINIEFNKSYLICQILETSTLSVYLLQ